MPLFGGGYLPDVPSIQDQYYTLLGASLDEVDLRPKFRNYVEHQYYTQSCVANAAVSCMEYALVTKYGSDPQFSFPELSRRFVYYEARSEDGFETVDRGCFIRSAIRRMAHVGVCEEALFPFFTDKVSMLEKPPTECYDEASRHKILKYERLMGLESMLDCLSSGFPFVFGFMTYKGSIETAGRTGKMPMPDGRQNGGHAVCAVGFKKSTKEFIIRNSYGDKWGDKGYCMMPFDYVANPDLSSDFWVIRDIEWAGD